VLLWLRYENTPRPFAELLCYSLALVSLLWGVIRDNLSGGAGFILQRSWNIVLTEKDCEGLHFR